VLLYEQESILNAGSTVDVRGNTEKSSLCNWFVVFIEGMYHA